MNLIVEAPLIHVLAAYALGVMTGASLPIACLWLLETYLKRKGL
jgi:hypothetical protein